MATEFTKPDNDMVPREEDDPPQYALEETLRGQRYRKERRRIYASQAR